jgi:[ribosomal protein S18]-alanine N-acetyltransferase
MNKPAAAKYVSILWANQEHADTLANLHAALFPQAWDAASFHQLLADPGATSFLARAGNPPEMVGFIVGRLVADEAEILTLGVRNEWQRQGIGRQLVEALARAAKKADVHRLYLEVSVSNGPALLLYKRLGFEEAGRRKGYYENRGEPPEDAINLSLAL